jgi:S-methylmethionine-dependent homocysteine/selenocysteine methylase
MYGMFEMMIKIFKNCAPSISEKVVREKDLIESIFKEYLFASVFKQTTSQEKTMVQLANEKVKRKGKSNSDKGSNKSREIAYTLLNELIRKSPVIMNNFIALQLKPLMDLIKRPTIWNYQLSDEKGE